MTGWTTEIVDSMAGLAGLEPAWRELAACVGAEPFQTFDWHAAWFASLGAAAGYRPHLALLRSDGRLVGLLPLARRRHRGLRVLEWSGYGMTDYNAAILAPELDPPAAHAALWRAASAGGADVARLTNVVPGLATDQFLGRLGEDAAPGETTWAVDVAGTDGAGWIAGLSPGLRRNHQRYTRKLEAAGVLFWIWSPGEPTAPFLEALVAQKRAWFRRTGQPSFLDGEAGPAFLAEAAGRMAARGALHLAALRSDDRFVACMLSFRGHRTLYAYTVSRDEAWNQFGPGQLLFMHLIRWCADEGIARVDLLGGDQDFKPRLGCRPTRLRNHVLPCSLVGRAALAARRLRKAGGIRPERKPEAAGLGPEAARLP